MIKSPQICFPREQSDINSPNRTFGTFGNIQFSKAINPFPGWTNNVTSMASFYAAQMPTSPTSSSLGSGWSASWSSSGSEFIATLSYYTVSDYYLIPAV